MTTATLIREYGKMKPCPIVQELLGASTSYSQFIYLVAERLGVAHARRFRFLTTLVKRDERLRSELQQVLQTSFDMTNDASKRHFWFALTGAQTRQKVRAAKALEARLIERKGMNRLGLLSVLPETLFIPFFGSYGEDRKAAIADAMTDIANSESDYPDSEL